MYFIYEILRKEVSFQCFIYNSAFLVFFKKINISPLLCSCRTTTLLKLTWETKIIYCFESYKGLNWEEFAVTFYFVEGERRNMLFLYLFSCFLNYCLKYSALFAYKNHLQSLFFNLSQWSWIHAKLKIVPICLPL